MGDETSPRPWKWGDGDSGIWDANDYGVLAANSSGSACWLGVKQADAAFIIRAVNAHDELVSALEDALEACRELSRQGWGDCIGLEDDENYPGYARARSLLTRIKGGTP